jgi:tetratricopeptide (TPR) repeat protein
MSTRKAGVEEDWISQLSGLADKRGRRRLLRQHSRLRSQKVVESLYQEVVRLVRVDLQRAARVAQAAAWLAEDLNDDYARAQSVRAAGHIEYLAGNYKAALERHQAAVKILLRLAREQDAARAMVNQLQPLIYLGRYRKAYALADQARRIYEKHGDKLRLARLDTNVGNVLYRQDRFSEAIELYRRSYEYFVEHGEVEDIAIVLRNIAVCYISLNCFEQALRTYQEAREYCEQHQMPLLSAEVDYNVAYLHYLRGEYMRAIELYDATRILCCGVNDRYHAALCDLDESELYLELNLSEEGDKLAHRAHAGFQKLGMGYEAAKALTFRGVAAGQQGKAAQALMAFDQARKLFVREANQFWPPLVDIYKALVLMQLHADRRARALCESALKYFRSSPAVSKAALCEVVLARLDLHSGKTQSAYQHCRAALKWLKGAESPAVEFQVYALLGQVEEAMGRPDAAYHTFLRAHQTLEGLRSHLFGEEFKIAFLKDKLSVYEHLVCLALARDKGENGHRVAFDLIERAKSRGLADLIGFSLYALKPKESQDRELVTRINELRQRLTLVYRQAQREEFSGKEDASARVRKLRRRTRQYEHEFAGAFSHLGFADHDFASLLNAGAVSLEEVRASLPAGAQLLEYYQARGTIYACILGADHLQVVPLASAGHVRDVFRLLQFQLSKFGLKAEYMSRFGAALYLAAQSHLRDLHACLISPLRRHLQAQHLVVVPHGFLHYLPFHALWDGRQYLSDEFALSYAPSASVYCLCSKRQVAPLHESLVLGIPDRLAPHILDEARAVAAVLPNARLFLGDGATQDLLWQYAPSCRFVHIATHGLFRQDNPMFSSIRLGQSDLNLFDLYQLRLCSELITLSGCGTGLNVVVGGDELLGLVRGLLYAGTQAVLATLWDVNDESTSIFMKSFYEELFKTTNKAAALQQAMRALRQRYPHPYHWAPFVLVGKFDCG